MNIIPKGNSSAPQSKPMPQVTVNTGSMKTTAMQKLDALKGRLMGQAPTTEAPKNKQGEVIPPQPTSLKPEVSNQPTIETPKAAPEAPKEAQSPQLQLLARQQQAIRIAQQKLKAEQEAWKQEQAKYLQKDILASDPLKALAEAGISQDRLVELQLNQSTPPSETELLKLEIAELKKKLDGVDETFKSRDKQAYDQALNTIKKDTELLVNSDPAYETIKALGPEGVSEVVELIKKQFAKDGTVIDVEDAAKQIEELALEREYERVQRLTQLSKIKQKLAPKSEEPPVTEAIDLKQSSQATATLTNKMGINRPLTARERAILAFQQAANNK